MRPVALRNRRALDLSRRLRAAVGQTMRSERSSRTREGWARRDYWQPFPYAELAAIYDVFVPMVYSTYRGDGPAVVSRDVTRSMTILRTATGRSSPVHLIGGLGHASSSGAEARAFRAPGLTLRPQGWSLYDFSVTAPSAWTALGALGQ